MVPVVVVVIVAAQLAIICYFCRRPRPNCVAVFTLQDRNRVNSEEKLLTSVHITAAETSDLILWNRNSLAARKRLAVQQCAAEGLSSCINVTCRLEIVIKSVHE